MGRVTTVSWNRSVLAPYLVSAAGADSMIVNHDIRMRNSMVNCLKFHRQEVVSLQWSPNASHTLMRQSDATNIYLSSTSLDSNLAVWRLSDLQYG